LTRLTCFVGQSSRALGSRFTFRDSQN
jgi:hypothetical protein